MLTCTFYSNVYWNTKVTPKALRFRTSVWRESAWFFDVWGSTKYLWRVAVGHDNAFQVKIEVAKNYTSNKRESLWFTLVGGGFFSYFHVEWIHFVLICFNSAPIQHGGMKNNHLQQEWIRAIPSCWRYVFWPPQSWLEMRCHDPWRLVANTWLWTSHIRESRRFPLDGASELQGPQDRFSVVIHIGMHLKTHARIMAHVWILNSTLDRIPPIPVRRRFGTSLSSGLLWCCDTPWYGM